MDKSDYITLIKAFCVTHNLDYIRQGESYLKEIVKQSIEEIHVPLDDKICKHKYWMLKAYFSNIYLRSDKEMLRKDGLCIYLSNINLDNQEQHGLFYTVYNKINLEGVTPSLHNINNSYLSTLFYIIDSVYFSNYFSGFTGVLFKLTEDDTNVAGSCKREVDVNTKTCRFIISIGRNIITSSFESFGSQRVNGVSCHNPLECLIRVFLHEIIHFIIKTQCPEYDADSSGKHSFIFNQISLRLFGHTDYIHEFGYEVHPIQHSKNTLNVGDKVEFKLNIKDNTRTGTVHRLNYKIVEFNLKKSQKTVFFIIQ